MKLARPVHPLAQFSAVVCWQYPLKWETNYTTSYLQADNYSELISAHRFHSNKTALVGGMQRALLGAGPVTGSVPSTALALSRLTPGSVEHGWTDHTIS